MNNELVIAEQKALITHLGRVVEKQEDKIVRRDRAISGLAVACVLSVLYIAAAAGCPGRWPIVITGGGHGGGEGQTVEGDK